MFGLTCALIVGFLFGINASCIFADKLKHNEACKPENEKEENSSGVPVYIEPINLSDDPPPCNYECTDAKPMCSAIHPTRKYGCTRNENHDGPHVACGSEHNYVNWDQEEEN